jgi:hypothetical protein
LCATALCCSPAPRGNALQKGIQAGNARIWLAPIINTSDIASLEGWPADTLDSAILWRRFQTLESRLLAELRRCEKYGLYTMVDAKNDASMTMTVTLLAFKRSHDTVTIPVNVHVETISSASSRDFAFRPHAPASRVERELNHFHYAGLILLNYVNNFPYNGIAQLLYAKDN